MQLRTRQPCPTASAGRSLNSLCGISVNATILVTWFDAAENHNSSQFPLWDFGECNNLGRCQHGLTRPSESQHSQFPLWDFGECNSVIVPTLMVFGVGLTLNSLCGISVNATDAVSPVFRGIGGKISGSYRLPRSCNSPYKDKNTI
jgi:hypothetical protein